MMLSEWVPNHTGKHERVEMKFFAFFLLIFVSLFAAPARADVQDSTILKLVAAIKSEKDPAVSNDSIFKAVHDSAVRAAKASVDSATGVALVDTGSKKGSILGALGGFFGGIIGVGAAGYAFLKRNLPKAVAAIVTPAVSESIFEPLSKALESAISATLGSALKEATEKIVKQPSPAGIASANLGALPSAGIGANT